MTGTNINAEKQLIDRTINQQKCKRNTVEKCKRKLSMFFFDRQILCISSTGIYKLSTSKYGRRRAAAAAFGEQKKAKLTQLSGKKFGDKER